MRIRVEFGVPARKVREINWYEELKNFPRAVKFENETWEWISYDKCYDGDCEYVITFGTSVTLNDLLELPDFEAMFRWQLMMQERCECGAKYDRGFEKFHSYWCPKWGKE